MSGCRFTPESIDDLKAALDHIARDRPGAAVRVIDKLEDQCNELASFPEMGRRRDELASGLRSFPSGSYLIFYRVMKDGIEIIRVLHGARDMPSIFEID
jgi:toxin ParE1/3/4